MAARVRKNRLRRRARRFSTPPNKGGEELNRQLVEAFEDLEGGFFEEQAEVENQLPITQEGDLLTRNESENIRLAVGEPGQVLTSVDGRPAWQDAEVPDVDVVSDDDYTLASGRAPDLYLHADDFVDGSTPWPARIGPDAIPFGNPTVSVDWDNTENADPVRAVEFDGVDDYFTADGIAGDHAGNPTTPFFAIVVLNAKGSSGANQKVFCFGTSTGSSDSGSKSLALTGPGTGKLTIERVNDAGGVDQITDSNDFPAGHRVLSLWFDETLSPIWRVWSLTAGGSGIHGGGPEVFTGTQDNVDQFTIGARRSGGNVDQFFEGSIRKILVWNLYKPPMTRVRQTMIHAYRRGASLPVADGVSPFYWASPDFLPIGERGDMVYHDGTTVARLTPLGTSGGEVLTMGADEVPSWEDFDIQALLPLTTRGDLLTVSSSQNLIRRPIGSADQVLTATASGDAVWRTPSTGVTIPLTTQGDIMYHNGSGLVRLPRGVNGQILRLVSNEPDWSDETTAGGTVPHADTHLWGGSDEIDGDRLDIDFVPSNYTRTVTGGGITIVSNQLSSHFKGIDDELGDIIGDVSTNTTNVAANTTNIATNTTNIATNTSDITDIENTNFNQDIAIANLTLTKPFLLQATRSLTLTEGTNIENVTVTGAVVGDPVIVNPDTAPWTNSGTEFKGARVLSANTVEVRFFQGNSSGPLIFYRISVLRFP